MAGKEVKEGNESTRARITKNIFSLGFLQALDLFIPFITFPYLVRVFGPEKFGLISFAQAISVYFLIIADYSFELTATKKVAIVKSNKQDLDEIFWNVNITKLLLVIIALFCFCCLVFGFSFFKENREIYIACFLAVIIRGFFPTWFFLGMEKIKYQTIVNGIIRILFTIYVFTQIKVQEDVLKYLAGFGISNFLIVVFTQMIAIIKFDISLIKFAGNNIIKTLKDGFDIFISKIGISFYTVSNTVILGIFTTESNVGIYSAAEKIVNYARSILSPVTVSIFPHLSYLHYKSKDQAKVFTRKILKVVIPITIVMSLFLFFGSEWIVSIILGDSFESANSVIKIIAFLPFIIGLSNIFGIQTMIPAGFDKEFKYIILAASVINIIISIMIVPYLKEIGTAVSVTITECFVTIAMFVFLYRKGIRYV